MDRNKIKALHVLPYMFHERINGEADPVLTSTGTLYDAMKPARLVDFAHTLLHTCHNRRNFFFMDSKRNCINVHMTNHL